MMSRLGSQLESLLLVAGRPLSFVSLAKIVSCSTDEVKEAIRDLEEHYNTKARGIHLMVNDGKAQLVTNPENKKIVAEFIKDETTGELTRPSLESLTIIAYRQPITKENLEQIRGVNCSLILRNLLMRGLVEPREEGLATTYTVTMDFLRFLGINRVEELPDYDKLHSHESVRAALEAAQQQKLAAAQQAQGGR